MSASVREQLIAALRDNKGEFISGQALAEKIGCSRTAVWKHIEGLRNDGFVLEAVRKKGYKIVSSPEQLSETNILYDLKTKKMGQKVYYYDTLASTQTVAHEFAQNGAPEGTIVIAEEQTAGRGRMARAWHSLKEKGIWMSLVIRPELPPNRAPQFTLIAAIAMVRAIEDVTGVCPDIKWPNDILIGGKKVTGILTEMSGEADHIHYLIIGIGMNVNHQHSDFPEDVSGIATSLAIETGKIVDRQSIIRSFLTQFEKYYELYVQKGFAPLKILWEGYSSTIGKNIIARTITGEVAGEAVGITDTGVLQVLDEKGQLHEIYSADVEMKS